MLALRVFCDPIIIIVPITPRGPWELGRAGMISFTSWLGTWRRPGAEKDLSRVARPAPLLPPL